MHTELVESVARAPRGQAVSVQTKPGMGVIYALQNGLPEYGMEIVEIEAFRAAEMSGGELVDVLNDVRLCDKVLVLTGVTSLDRRDQAMIQLNLNACFLKHGGRAVPWW